MLALFGCTPVDPGDDPVPSPVPTPRCNSDDRLEAPEPLSAGEVRVAPVDLLTVDATVSVQPDGLVIEATARFLAADDPTALAVLELQPTPEDPLLDGQPVLLQSLTVSDPPRDLVSLGALPPCTEHVLTVRYTLPPDWRVEDGGPLRFEPHPDGVFWAAGFTDSRPGRFLSIWLPSNVLFDRFDLTMRFDVSALGAPHELSTTGEAVAIEGGWEVS